MYEDQYGEFICGYWDLKVNEYLNKQEIQLDGCKLVVCYQKLPRRCTLASHAAIFVSLYNTPLITKPSEKITDIPGGGGMTSTTFNKARWKWGVPSVEGMDIFWNNTFEL